MPFLARFIAFRCIYTPFALAFKIGLLLWLVACGVFLLSLSLCVTLPGYRSRLSCQLLFLCRSVPLCRCFPVWDVDFLYIYARIIYNNAYKYLHFALWFSFWCRQDVIFCVFSCGFLCRLWCSLCFSSLLCAFLVRSSVPVHSLAVFFRRACGVVNIG